MNRRKPVYYVVWLAQRGRGLMGNHAVTLKVTPFLRIECKFWLTDDGWSGSCEQPPITVQAGSFEHVKSEMEIALGKYVESLLRESQRSNTRQAA
jgi:predicted RNase H-like HicB family nuclease